LYFTNFCTYSFLNYTGSRSLRITLNIGESTLSLAYSVLNLSFTLIPVQNNNQILFSVSTLKYSTIRIIWIFPPDTSYTCFTIFTQSYSKSELRIGELIESEDDRYSGPSKVHTLSNKGFRTSFILFLFVFLCIKQN